MQPRHRYSIRPADPAAHLFEVRLTVERPHPAGQVFAMPAWIPGSYMIRDYAKHVVSAEAKSGERGIALEKIDKSRWRSEPFDGPVTLVIEVFAWDPSVRGAHLDTTHAYFNGPCVFPSVVGQEGAACDVDILPPAGGLANDWRVATSMRRKGAGQYGFGSYEAASYEDLIDHPVEIGHLTIGEFDVDGIPHAIAIRGKVRVDMARLCHDLEKICTEHMSLLGKPSDLDRYLFLLHAPASGYGGLEHAYSSSLVCARDSLPQRGADGMTDAYRSFLGLASHEYFHLWNVKRMKPAAFTPYDLSGEVPTRLLWVFEGVTSYYDDLALVRSGLIGESDYLELLGRTITRVMRGPGRKRQSVAESSFDAWTKFYKPDANSANAVVSYYAKGALIALALDLRLRSESGGRVSLDDVLRACWKQYGESGTGMPERGFEQVCEAVSGQDLGDFFDAAVRGTAELPLEQLLATHGVRLGLRPATGGDDKGGKPSEKSPPVWLGATLGTAEGAAVFSNVINGGPAERGGIAPGDRAIALDGFKLDAGNLDKRLKQLGEGDEVELVVFRDDVLLTTRIRLEAPPEDTAWLELDDDAGDAARKRRKEWLAG